MMAACYKNSNNDDESDNNNKSDNNKDKIYLLLKRWGWVGHVLDHVLDHIIIGLVTMAVRIFWLFHFYNDYYRHQPQYS